MKADIRTRVDSFVNDLSELIRRAALEAVQQALGAELAPAGRRTGAAPKQQAGRKKASSKAAGRKVKGASTEDVVQTAGELLAVIRSEPGKRLEEIARNLNTSTDALRPAISMLLEEGRVRTEGKARGTRYLAGGGASGKKAASKKKANGRKEKQKKQVKKAKKAARRSTASTPAA
jgi:hypothetical protein